MATIKVKFRPSSASMKEGALFFQVIHNRVVRQIGTGYRVYPEEWDALTLRVVAPPEAGKARCRYLQAVARRIQEDGMRLQNALTKLEQTGRNYTADDVVALYTASPAEGGFLAFCRSLIGQLRAVGRVRTAETYTAALNSFVRFRGNSGDVSLNEVDSTLLMAYEGYLKSRKVCPNSSSYYMRNLRAMYNRAVEKELIVQRNPFRHVYTGIDKTVSRAVPAKVIRQIRELDLALTPSMDLARDIFMFSFYTRGMSFIDMAYLRKTDLQHGVLSYRRQKTGQQLFVKWEKPMQAIVDKYDTTGTPYLLPLIKDVNADERRQYKSAEHLINCKLKKIGQLLGLNIPLTTYVARHGWASIAKSMNIPISTISEAMGHDSESTTRIYLASLDTSVVDEANSVILKSI